MFADVHPAEAPPRRRWRFWMLLFGGPLLVLVLSGIVWIIRANVGLQAAIDEADRLDPRWRLEEIEADRATVPAGKNAADKIASIGTRAIAFRWPVETIGKFNLLADESPERQLDAEQSAAVKDLLHIGTTALADARSLIDTPRGRRALVYAPDWFSTIQPNDAIHRIGFLLRLDVFDRAQSGDIDGAVRSSQAEFNVGSSLGDEPRLVSQNTRISVQRMALILLERALAQGEASAAVLAAFQVRLEAAEPEPLLLYAMRGERAGTNRLMDNLRDGTVTLPALSLAGTAPKALALDDPRVHVPGYIAVQQTRYLHFMTQMVEIAKGPPEQWFSRMSDLQGDIDEFGVGAPMASGLIKWARTCCRKHAHIRCAIVAIATERYRRQKGQWPTMPDDLVKAGLLKSVPGDPFVAGQFIKFARRADGITVYSVGDNGIDDGGDLTKNRDGIGADIGFRLWDVTARRQPAKP